MGFEGYRAAVALALAALGGVASGCTFDGVVEVGSADGSGSGSGATSGGASSGSASSSSSGSSGTTGRCGDIQFVQAVPGTSEYQVQVNRPSQSQTITERAGDLLVAIAFAGQGPGSSIGGPNTSPNMTFTLSDSLGNRYHAAGMYENGNSHQAALQMFYAANIAGGANVVTVTTSAQGVPSNNYFTGLLLQEYAGMASSEVVDLSAGQMAPSRTMPMVPGSITTRAGCDLIVGAYADGHVTATPMYTDGGFVFRSTDVWCPAGAVDDAPEGAGADTAVNPQMFLQSGVDRGWVAAQVALRAAGTSAPPQPDALEFANPPLTIQHGSCGGPVSVESVAGAAPTPSAVGIEVSISGPPGVAYYVDPACAYPLPGASSNELFIGAGTDSESFYFESANAIPNATITVSSDGGFAPTSQTEVVN